MSSKWKAKCFSPTGSPWSPWGPVDPPGPGAPGAPGAPWKKDNFSKLFLKKGGGKKEGYRPKTDLQQVLEVPDALVVRCYPVDPEEVRI